MELDLLDEHFMRSSLREKSANTELFLVRIWGLLTQCMYITTPQDFDIYCILAYVLQNYDFIYQSASNALDIKHSLSGFLAIFHSAELFVFTRIQ